MQMGYKVTETLGEVIRDLRETVGETQGTFADRFHCGRTRITEIENNRLSGEELRKMLVGQFPEARSRIEDAVDVVIPRSRHRRSFRELRQEVERLTQNQELEAAVALLAPFTTIYFGRSIPDGWEDKDVYWASSRAFMLYSDLGRFDDAWRVIATAACALSFANLFFDDVTYPEHNYLVQKYLQVGNITEAHNAVNIWLRGRPTMPLVWLEKGMIYWVEQAYIQAYTALTTALSFRAPRHAVWRLRAQVLAEWEDGRERAPNAPLKRIIDIELMRDDEMPGIYYLALEDIAAYLNSDIKDDIGSCEVLSARAYAHGRWTWPLKGAKQLKAIEAAQEDFALAEQHAKGVGIHYYRLGRFYQWNGDLKAAIEAYDQAIESTNPGLDIVRRRETVDRISNLRKKPKYKMQNRRH